MKKLSVNEIEKLKEQFLGKKVQVIANKKNYVGYCEFIGYNPFFSNWGLQVTLNRTPVTRVDPKSIKLFESNS